MRQLAYLSLLLAVPAFGQVRPVAGGPDPMHQTVAYAEGQTIILEVAPGFQLAVELGQGEKIRSAAAGDGASWQIAAPEKASQFFVRPNGGATPTNLTVVTNRHSHYFLLLPAPQMTVSGALSVRVVYPAELTAAGQRVEPGRPLGTYRFSGSALIRPSSIWDDGEKTFVDWPEDVEAPAIFAIDSAGEESLVNSYRRDGKFVIDAVYSRLQFRLDHLTARADRKVVRP